MNATILVLQLWFFGLPNSQPLGGPFVSASECVEQVQRYNDSPVYRCPAGLTVVHKGDDIRKLCPPVLAKCYQETVPVQFDPSRLRDATKENRK